MARPWVTSCLAHTGIRVAEVRRKQKQQTTELKLLFLNHKCQSHPNATVFVNILDKAFCPHLMKTLLATKRLESQESG